MLSQTALVMADEPVPDFTSLERGIILQRTLQTDSNQRYLLYVPRSAGNGAKIFVTVHGISRNVMEHAKRFAPFAEKYGVVMIAPYFPADRFPDFQRLGRKDRGERADVMLNEIVTEAVNLTRASAHKLYLFGYSGGAQFVHRYMLAYPDRVAKAVLGAPGWYSFPDENLKYPIGIRKSRSLPQVQFDPARFLTVPVCVLVGERDNRRDAELNKSPQIDLLQGTTRLERGRRWVDAMAYQAQMRGLMTPYLFHTLPRSPHSFRLSMLRGGMGEKTFDFLFAENAGQNAS